MATREDLITELEREIARYAHHDNSQEADWSRSASLAVARLRSSEPTQDDEAAAEDLLAKIRNGFLR